jgi:pimeloyl-[acyl-carrier protein] methyl ester esterase
MAENLVFTTTHDNNVNDVNRLDKTPVVLLHGWSLNSGVWQPLLERLSTEENSAFEFITLDLPGFGLNSHISLESYSLSTICNMIESIITKPAIYLGWSLGGLVATQMALNYPHKVLGLITVASTPYFVEEKDTFETIVWPGIKANILTSFHQQLAQDTKKTISGFLKIQTMGSPHIRQDLKQITQLVMAHALPTKRTLDDSLNLLSNSDFRDALSTIKQPFLRLYGNNDSLVPKGVINLITSLAPKSQCHIFSQASHAPFISHLDDFNSELQQWLTNNFIDH